MKIQHDPFTLIDLELPTNSYMISCTDTQGFEERENSASTISMEHTLGSDMNLFGSDMILFGSNFKVQELLVILVAVLINICVKNQAPQVSFKSYVVGDSISVSSCEFTDVLDSDSLDILEAISYYGAQ